MLPPLLLHASDEDLIRLRDGQPVDEDRERHVEQCPLCQELLQAWRELGDAMQDLRVLESQSEARKIGWTKDDILWYSGMAERHGELSFDLASQRPQAQLPDDWTVPLLPKLIKRPPVVDAGLVEVVYGTDGSVSLRRGKAVTGPGEEMAEGAALPEELVVPLREARLNLSTRRAGHAVFLVARVEGPSSWGKSSRSEMTLIPERGEQRVQRLSHGRPDLEGMAWFRLPPRGPAHLFVHLNRTARVRLEPVFDRGLA